MMMIEHYTIWDDSSFAMGPSQRVKQSIKVVIFHTLDTSIIYNAKPLHRSSN